MGSPHSDKKNTNMPPSPVPRDFPYRTDLRNESSEKELLTNVNGLGKVGVFYFSFFLATLHGMLDPSSRIRD